MGARAGADSITRAIGGRVRQGRSSRGWTLDQLAERSGVSRRMLVSIEQGSANPSIATLLLISDALGIGLPALVDMDRSPGLRVTRAGAAPVLWRGGLGGHHRTWQQHHAMPSRHAAILRRRRSQGVEGLPCRAGRSRWLRSRR